MSDLEMQIGDMLGPGEIGGDEYSQVFDRVDISEIPFTYRVGKASSDGSINVYR